jgi:GNAT superfamily N-acetyltransferase
LLVTAQPRNRATAQCADRADSARRIATGLHNHRLIWHETDDPSAYARSVACARRPVRQGWRQQRLLVHAPAARRLGPEYHRRPREKNKAALRNIVKRGPPPGLLAFDGDLAVGWCQLTSRDDLAWLNQSKPLGRVDDAPVWSLSCFYIRRGYRNRGVMSALIAAAVKAAKQAGAPALEAYPVDTDAPKRTTNIYAGTASAFARAGFKTVVARAPSRPIMRHDLKGIAL